MDYKCILCGGNDWKNVDEFRYRPQGMAMCTSCAMITYPEKCSKIDKVNQHYEHDYRQAPTVNNLFSSERKLHYHVVFLAEIFEKWNQEKKTPVVLEIGAALGMFLSWAKSQWPKAEVHGTELTKSFVNVAREVYGLALTPDFDDTKKYDLIMSYKVAEHMPDVPQQLARYRSSLSEGGKLYISVPTWFGRLNDFGSSGYNIENYYDPNHVNVWSQKQFEYLLRKCGFKVIKENHTFYDDTYLCEVGDFDTDHYKEDPTLRIGQLKNIYDASLAFDQGRFADAIKAWPNFPMAQVSIYEQNRSRIHREGFEEIWKQYLKPAWDVCGNTHFILVHICDIMMRYNQYQKALELCKLWLDHHPMDTQALMNMSHCLRQEAVRTTDEKERDRLLRESISLLKVVKQGSLERSHEAITWIMQDAALLSGK